MPDIKRLLFALAAAVFALSATTPALAQTEVRNPPPVWKHRVLGVPFPDRIGDFVRSSVVEYDAEGADASVNYNLVRENGPFAKVTLYVYPPQERCEENYEGARFAITSRYAGAALVDEGKRPSPGGTPDAAHFSVYTFDYDVTGKGPEPVRSQLYVWCTPDSAWSVKYRATYSADVSLDEDVIALLRAIRWPPPLDR